VILFAGTLRNLYKSVFGSKMMKCYFSYFPYEHFPFKFNSNFS